MTLPVADGYQPPSGAGILNLPQGAAGWERQVQFVSKTHTASPRQGGLEEVREGDELSRPRFLKFFEAAASQMGRRP